MRTSYGLRRSGAVVALLAATVGSAAVTPAGALPGPDDLEPSAGISVTTVEDVVDADDDDVSLREAAIASSAATGTFLIQLSPGTYELTRCEGEASGPLAFEGADVTLRGVDADPPSLVQTCGAPSGRSEPTAALQAEEAVSLRVESLHVAGPGGGIVSLGGPAADLELVDVRISGVTGVDPSNAASAVTSTAPLHVERTTIEDGVDARGVEVPGDVPVQIVDSTIRNNRVHGEDGGGLFVGGAVRIDGSLIQGNNARDGAGIFHDPHGGGSLEVVDSTIEGNVASDVGGGLSADGGALVEGSTIVDNQAGWFGGGTAGHLRMRDSTVVGNRAGLAGGGSVISPSGSLAPIEHEVVASTYSANEAPTGAAIQLISSGGTNGARIDRTTIAGNIPAPAGEGGWGHGGAVAAVGENGAEVVLEVVASTLIDNHPLLVAVGDAPASLDLVAVADEDAGTTRVSVGGSVLGTVGGRVVPGCAAVGLATIESSGGNVTADDSCGDLGTAPYDLADVGDVGLRTLGDHGGPTETVLPDRGSPVLDRVPAADPACDVVGLGDQRGVPRPQGPGCDSGAFEVEVEACATAGLADVGADHRFCAAIGWAWWTAITDGYDDGTFRSADPVSRQAMVAFLARWSEATVAPSPCGAAPFPDVAVISPFCGEIGWAAADGITGGYDDGTFRPAVPVSRQAAVTFLARIRGVESATLPCAGDRFDDVGPQHRFCGAIEWAAAEGITEGYDDGTFRPTGPVSRQAAVAFLHRLAGATGD